MELHAKGRLTGSLIGVLIVLAASCTDTTPAATSTPPPTAAPPADSRQPAPSLDREVHDTWIAAAVAPNVATAGERFVVTPTAAVQHRCGVAIAFYTPIPWGGGELIGVLLGGGEWVPFDPAVSTTVLDCLPPPASDPIEARVPAELADGLYEACISSIGGPDGCGLLRLVRPGSIASDAADATADPDRVAPGDGFTVTPADDDARVCSRYELHTGVGGRLDLLGFPASDGGIQLPVPGATTTVPRCGAVGGVSTVPVTFVAPDVPDGPYLFCLASRFEPNGCARVMIER